MVVRTRRLTEAHRTIVRARRAQPEILHISAQLGATTIEGWNSRVQSLDLPFMLGLDVPPPRAGASLASCSTAEGKMWDVSVLKVDRLRGSKGRQEPPRSSRFWRRLVLWA